MAQIIPRQASVVLKLHSNSSWRPEDVHAKHVYAATVEQAQTLLAPLAVMDRNGNILRAIELLEKALEDAESMEDAENDEDRPKEALL